MILVAISVLDKRLEDKIHRDLPPDDAVVNSIIKVLRPSYSIKPI